MLPQGNIGLVYIYFEYAYNASHGQETVLLSFLKQLLCQLGDIPRDVIEAYNIGIKRNSKADFETVFRLFISVAARFSSVYAFFDAFDECNQQHQQDIFKLIQSLSTSSIKVMLTSQDIFELLRGLEKFSIPITAQAEDIHRYLSSRLEKEVDVPQELRKEILDTLITKAEGMYADYMTHC
jgi:hypothetical protein